MRKFLAPLAALGVAAGISTVAHAAIVYTINQSSTIPEVSGELSPLSDTVSGTITTDGTIGVIQSSNILDYDLKLIDNIRPAYDVELTPANSGIWYDTGGGLTATATTMSFNFSDAGAVFIIQGLLHGFSSGYQYFCFQASTGPCIQGETIVPDYFSLDGVSATGLVGTVPLSGAPEPGAWAMMLLGLLGVGAVTRRQAGAAARPLRGSSLSA